MPYEVESAGVRYLRASCGLPLEEKNQRRHIRRISCTADQASGLCAFFMIGVVYRIDGCLLWQEEYL